jgi:chemotaxis-related protein WspB
MLLLNFTAGPNRYAIDVTRVVELVPRVELRLIPHAPPALAGLLGYRGHVVPVIDLGILLGASACRYCLSTRIILVRCAGDDHDHSGPDPGFAAAGKDKARQDPSGPSSLLGLIAWARSCKRMVLSSS